MAMATAPNNNIIVESNCAWSDDVLDFLQGIDVDAGTAWEDDADAAHPDAKRAKVNHGRVGNTAARRKQNREAARRSRLRKKHQEIELQQKVKGYTKSNEYLKKLNEELQDMLDLARYQAANITNGSKVEPIVIPESDMKASSLKDVANPLAVYEPVADPLAVPTSISVPSNDVFKTTDTEMNYLDVLLENDEWLGKSDEPKEVSDEGSDTLDLLLDSESWMNSDDMEDSGCGPLSDPQPVIVSPVLSTGSKPPVTFNQSFQLKSLAGRPLSRKEKNRIHARNRRMRVKFEHIHLKRTVDAYTQSNAKLKQKNKELELMLLKAHTYVAGATQGYQHYASVFAQKSDSSKSTDFSSRRSSIQSDFESSVFSENDGDHAMSFLWK